MHQVDDGRLIAKQDPVNQQILCFHDRAVQPQACGCGQPLASLLVGTGNSVRPGVRATNGHAPGRASPEPTELGVDEFPETCPWRLSGDGPELGVLVGQGEDDEETILGGHQHVTVAETIQDDAFQRTGRGLDRGQAPLRSGQCDLVCSGQVQPKWLCPLHKLAKVGISPEQIVDQISSERLFTPHQFAAGLGVPFGEGGHGVLDDLKNGLGGGSHGRAVAFADHRWELIPHPPGSREVQVHSVPRRDPGLGCAPTEQAHHCDFAARGTPSRRGCLGEHRQVVPEQVGRHVPGVVARSLGHPTQPVVPASGLRGLRRDPTVHRVTSGSHPASVHPAETGPRPPPSRRQGAAARQIPRIREPRSTAQPSWAVPGGSGRLLSSGREATTKLTGERSCPCGRGAALSRVSRGSDTSPMASVAGR